jgi:hypothetical protein
LILDKKVIATGASQVIAHRREECGIRPRATADQNCKGGNYSDNP